MKIINKERTTPKFSTALIRETLGKIISAPFAIGFIYVGIDKEKQGLHDKIAKTHVEMTKSLGKFKKTLVWVLAVLPFLVLPILGFFAGLLLSSLNPVGRQAEARDSARKSDVGQIKSAVQAYYAGVGHGKYPASLEDMVASGDLKQVPTDSMGGQYYYQVSADNHSFAVYANLESEKKGVWCYTSNADIGTELSSASECVPR